MFERVDSIIIPNFGNWKNPLLNKYIETNNLDFEGILILRKKGKNIWLSHPFNYEQAKKELKNVIIKNFESKKDIEKYLKKYCGEKIGYDARNTTVSHLQKFKKIVKGKWIDISKEIEKNNEVKSENEIKKIKQAIKKTKTILIKTRKHLKKGMTEQEIVNFIKNEFEKDNYKPSFCIVAFGNNTKNIHHISGRKKLKEGPVLIDVCAKYKGYTSDITESFWFGKNEPEEYSNKKQKIKKELKKVEAEIKPGIEAKKLWDVLSIKMEHALGHGIGLEEHDSPEAISNKSKWKFKKGMVLAIEPATYNKYGIRIEKDYLVTKKGFKRL